MNWIYTTNHKRISINYFFFIIFSGTCGLMLATLIRMELAYPGVSIFMGDGIKYLMISTLHGIIMVFFMIIPLIFGAYGNYLLPLQLGVHDVAFPRMNSAAFWFLPAGLIMLCQLLSFDKRYHTVNCFNFNRIDSYINFTDIKNDYNSTLKLNNRKEHNLKINYNLFNNKSNTKSNVNLLYKYNLLNKNYSVQYNYFTPNYIFTYIFSKLIYTYYYFKLVLYTNCYYVYNVNILYWLSLSTNINIFSYYLNWYKSNKNTIVSLFTNIGLDNIVEILKDKINFNYNLNIIKTLLTHEPLSILFKNMKYSYFQSTYNNIVYNKAHYTTSFFFKQRNPLLIQNKFINVMFNSKIFYKQVNQYYKNTYNKYYLNIQSNPHMSGFRSNKNILLYSVFLERFFKAFTRNTMVHNNTMYLYKYNTRINNDFRLTTFDAKPTYNAHIMVYANWLSSNLFLYNYNHIFINQRSLAVIFKNNIMNINKHNQIFSKWQNLRFQREFWRCRSMITKNSLHNYKYHSDWSFLFDLNNKHSVLSDSADVLPGWAFVTPFSARTKYSRPGKTDVALFAIAISSFGSFIGSLNFLITYRYLSTLNNKKMRDARCFFAEGLLVGSGMMLAANPVLFIAIFLLLSDRHWKTSFFDYSNGGDTVLFQHLFWFFGHPEVYIIIIPCFGLINTILSYFLRKRLSARASLLYSMYTISFLSFFVWGHHMYMVGLSHHTRMLYSTITVMISVPAATKIMHWLVTIVNSSIHYELPLIFSIIFIFLFISGGISGMAVAHTGMDILFHDTFYVIGHFHVMFAGAAMFATFGAFYFYFPFIWGVKYNKIFAYFHLIYYLIGQLMTVIPMLWLGYAGMPRRILDYPAVFGGWHSIISSGHLISTAGIASFFIMLFLSLKQQKLAVNNTLGIGRYNTRINFYLYEYSKLLLIRRKYKIFLN